MPNLGFVFENALRKVGFEVYKNQTQLPQRSIIILTANDADSRCTAQVAITDTDEGTPINLTFQCEG